MIFEEKKIILKDGRSAIIRSPKKGEGQELLSLIKTVSGETENLLRYPEEWNITVEQEEAWIESVRNSESVYNIVCFIEGKAAGNCEIRFLPGIKMGHRATLGISILKEYWNLGIGSAFFSEIIKLAEAHGTEIMELEFIEGNERARHLYEKFGFKIVCEKPFAFKLKDGSYKSEFYMQRDLRK